MKKTTFLFLTIVAILISNIGHSQCLDGSLYPSDTFTPSVCDGVTPNIITNYGDMGEYSSIHVISGEIYHFLSSTSVYYTISTDNGATPNAYGFSPLTWVAPTSGNIRLYSHSNTFCSSNGPSVVKSVICGAPVTCNPPTIAFDRVLDCPNSSFYLTANVADMGSASSLIISDNAFPTPSTPQIINSTGMVTFGPYGYSNGSVSLKAVPNDDDRGFCTKRSNVPYTYGCPPPNDLCSDAITLHCGDQLTNQSTRFASKETSATCLSGDTDGIGNDIWYAYEGNGQALDITITASQFNYPQYEVYSSISGSCSEFIPAITCQLIPGISRSDTYLNRRINFVTQLGITYFFRFGLYYTTFQPNDPNYTTFGLSVSCPEAPINNDCSNAISLNCGGIITGQNSSGALYTEAVDCTNNTPTTTRGLWYTFSGNGYTTIWSTTPAGMTVFKSTGNCSNLSCVSHVTNSSTNNYGIEFIAEAGITYYIKATGTNFNLNVLCAPVNDLCEGAINMHCGDVLTNQSFTGATNGTAENSPNVWYSFVADAVQVIEVKTIRTVQLNDNPDNNDFISTGVATSIDGNCNNLSFIDSRASEDTAIVRFISEVGVTYYIPILRISTHYQTFELSINCADIPLIPANDEVCTAIPLTISQSPSCTNVTSGTIAGATASPQNSVCYGTDDDDVWYSFVATENLYINITSNTNDNSLNYSLWTGPDCNAIYRVLNTCSYSASTYTYPDLVIGQTYYIRVFSYTDIPLQNTTFDICLRSTLTPPPNDNCNGAIEITPGGNASYYPILGNTLAANTVSGLTFSCQNTRSHDVWYSVTVPASGSLTIQTDLAPGVATFDTVLSVFSGSCGSLTEIGCNDDGNSSFSKVVLTGLTPNTILYVGVWSYYGNISGEFLVSAYDASLLSNAAFENESFQSYPNPVKELLNLSYNKNISKVAVFNMLGQEVLNKSVNSNNPQIDMSHLTSGTYIVKATVEDQIKTIRVVKK